MRVRKVVTRSGKRFRGKFPSQKLGRMVHWESLLERDAIFHFEYHPLVLSYQEQPSIEIYYDENGEQHRYFPDFCLIFRDGSELYIEVKPKCDLQTPEVRNKLQAVAKRFAEQGRRFHVMDEDTIRRQPLLENLRALHTSSKRAARAIPNLELVKTLTGGPCWKLAQLRDQLQGIHKVLRLVQSNHLQIDLEQPLSDDSDVWPPEMQGGAYGSFRI
ncbi:TnsA endonuclease N-terminal domain-containing protein [Acidovorax radicis]|uniref:TnsA endonuclease N-terminal domain-containing protein n=1 Tax=Acidovorax radicis TaxID=758826 RepID=UPI001CF896FF|nr:TnsA endonuclease N-terminal domain-containing protein [Acidovorax radicis]UCU99254.1 TnsA endonuclease N-terminal domain-containing protein [Acidovorax radicis]